MPIRLSIADDHALFRQGLRSLLLLQSDIEVVSEVERADQLDATLAANPCDLLLLDLQMERWMMDEIAALSTRTKIIVLTASEGIEHGLMAIRLGARAIVQKRFAIETLMTAIRAVAEGLVWMPPSVQAALAVREQTRTRQLTARESEIVRLVASGMRNAEVAGRLSITESTVKTHLNNVFQKLDLRDRLELTHYAIRTGLIAVLTREP